MREDCGMTKIDMTNALRLPAGSVDLAAFDPRATPGLPEGEGKEDGYKRLAELDAELSDLQERLFAAGRSNPTSAPRILLVLQGMDTSGKGGVIRKAVGLVDPQGSRSQPSRRRPRRSVNTISCGASGGLCRSRA